MPPSSDNPLTEELLELTRQVCDGSIDEAGRGRLEALLHDHPEVRGVYLDYLELNARLAWRYRTGPPAGEPGGVEGASATLTTPHKKVSASSGSRAADKLAAVAAMLLATAAALALLFGPSVAPDKVAPSVASADIEPGFIATIRESTAAVWREGLNPLEVGGRVAPGPLRLGRGKADLILDSGVRLLVEGPADLSLDSADAAFLRTGKVAVFVPEHAIGFTLKTPTSTLVDQGTEFGVVAEESGATEVHVFRGQVDLVYSDGEAQEPKRLALMDHQARRVLGPGTEGAGVEYAPDRFQGLADRIAEPVGWPIAEGGNGHFYQLVVHENAVTWQQAALDATNRHHRGLRGHLATITTEGEHRFVVERLLRSSKATGVWMGLTDVLREGYFRWVTGEPFAYERWASMPERQPDNFIERDGHGGEDYGMFSNVLAGEPWAWNDLSNDSIHQSVFLSLVEYEPVAVGADQRSICSEPIGWTQELGGQGQHYRLFVSLEPLSWDETARRAAETSLLGEAGHLAALETESERRFVVDHILKVCGVSENLIGLATDAESNQLRWITGAPFAGAPDTTPNIPAESVYGQLRWMNEAWKLQTVAADQRPSGWYGYLVEYPPPAGG